MRKIVPAVETTICDRCGGGCHDTNHKHKAIVKIVAKQKDHMWEYHYAPEKQLDLCDECYGKLCEFLDGTPILE